MTPIEQSHYAVLFIVFTFLMALIRHQWPMQQARHEAAKARRRAELEAIAHAAVAHEEFLALHNPAHFERLLEVCPVQGAGQDFYFVIADYATGLREVNGPISFKESEMMRDDFLKKDLGCLVCWTQCYPPEEWNGAPVRFAKKTERDEELSAEPMPWTGVAPDHSQKTHMAHLGKNYNEADARDWRAG